MSSYLSMEELKNVVSKHIMNEVEHIVNDAIVDAKIQIERKIKEITGKIAARVFSQFEFHLNEHTLSIRVDTKDLKFS